MKTRSITDLYETANVDCSTMRSVHSVVAANRNWVGPGDRATCRTGPRPGQTDGKRAPAGGKFEIFLLTVSNAINQLGGVAVTDRNSTPIVHTTDYQVMLQEVLRTEQVAADTYKGILENTADNQELYDSIEQIYFAEVRSTEELNQLI